MRYDVTYFVGSEERTDRIDAPDAAAAAAAIQQAHGRGVEHFELISIQLLDPLSDEAADHRSDGHQATES